MLNLTARQTAVLQEHQRITGIRRSFTKWCQLCGFEPAAHHRLLIAELERVVRGETKRLAIFLPPGSAKSTYSSILFVPWFLAQGHNKIILSCSHSAELAASFGRKCRNLVEQHAKELGYDLAKDSKAADHWATSSGSEYFCAGVGAGLSGRRADLGLIDDPIGKKEDAESKLIRDKHWDWWEFDFLPRLKPNAPVVLIQTRWHEDDHAGRILAKETGKWRVLSVPLIAEENDALGRAPGAPLWPEWFTDKQYEDAKASSAFSSLYQCRPAPEDGDYFKKEWFEPALYHTMDQLPKELRNYCVSDHALTTKEENDRQCLIPFGLDQHDDIWIYPDVFWKRCDTFDLVEAMIDMMERRQPVEWWAEDEHIHKSIGPFLQKRMVERRVYTVVTGLTSGRDLQTRAQSIRGRMRMCKVHFPAFANEWWPNARHELLSFPVGTHDDFVAALAKIGQGLEKVTRPAPIESDPEEKLDAPFRPTLTWMKEADRRSRAPLTRYADR